MATPIVTIDSVNHVVLSTNLRESTIVFHFDMDVLQWVVCLGGNAPFRGKILFQGRKVSIDTPISITLDSSQLTEGFNQINLYGENYNGQWTPYNDDRLPASNNLIISVLGKDMYGQTILGGR
jgi:hypothetical protein